MFEVDMEVITLRAADGVVRQIHVVRGNDLALVQERRDDGDRVTAYVASGERDASGRRVFSDSSPALHGGRRA